MKKAVQPATLLVIFVFFAIVFSQQFSYVGADKCKICHRTEKQGRQYVIWQESKHSQSFVTLASEQAQSIARQVGLGNPQESSKCLQCHGPLFEKAADFKAEGVSCEICHGPGSAYKSLNVMKNRDEAVKNALILYDSPNAIKQQCLKCHENAHGKPFEFEASWEKIKHPVPEK